MCKRVGNSYSWLTFSYFGIYNAQQRVYSMLPHAFAYAACSDFLLWQKQKNEKALIHIRCKECWGFFSGALMSIARLNMLTQHLVAALTTNLFVKQTCGWVNLSEVFHT